MCTTRSSNSVRWPSFLARCKCPWLHERSGRNAAEPDYLPDLQRELIAVISKYIKINPDDIKVNLERQDNLEVLEVKIELPDAR